MKFIKRSAFCFFLSLFVLSSAQAAEWLVKLSENVHPSQVEQYLQKRGMRILGVESLRFNSWYLVRTATEAVSPVEGRAVGQLPGTRWVEPNKRIRPFGGINNELPAVSAPKARRRTPFSNPSKGARGLIR